MHQGTLIAVAAKFLRLRHCIDACEVQLGLDRQRTLGRQRLARGSTLASLCFMLVCIFERASPLVDAVSMPAVAWAC
jgi:hypothetical protein